MQSEPDPYLGQALTYPRGFNSHTPPKQHRRDSSIVISIDTSYRHLIEGIVHTITTRPLTILAVPSRPSLRPSVRSFRSVLSVPSIHLDYLICLSQTTPGTCFLSLSLFLLVKGGVGAYSSPAFVSSFDRSFQVPSLPFPLSQTCSSSLCVLVLCFVLYLAIVATVLCYSM